VKLLLDVELVLESAQSQTAIARHFPEIEDQCDFALLYKRPPPDHSPLCRSELVMTDVDIAGPKPGPLPSVPGYRDQRRIEAHPWR